MGVAGHATTIEGKNAYNIIQGPTGKRSLGRSRHRLKGIIRVIIKDIGSAMRLLSADLMRILVVKPVLLPYPVVSRVQDINEDISGKACSSSLSSLDATYRVISFLEVSLDHIQNQDTIEGSSLTCS